MLMMICCTAEVELLVYDERRRAYIGSIEN